MKRNLKILLILAAAVLLCGCSGGKKKEITVDASALAKDLAEQAVTSDTLTPAADAMLSSIYYLDAESITSGSAYMSGGSTACEAAVIVCKDEKYTETVKKEFEQRVSDQKERCESYNPEEVKKLDAAIIKVNGKYAVLCVCDDTKKAEEILKNAGF